VSLSGEAPDVLGDRDRLQQVIANLVDNATRMTPPEGTVEVRLSPADGRALIEVRDSGPGIPEADLPRLFDRFYRSGMSRDRATGGAGLGLAIVKAIVTAHGGTISASNSAGGGAVFVVDLPALTDPGTSI
jgi:signal transduction histidine kinase